MDKTLINYSKSNISPKNVQPVCVSENLCIKFNTVAIQSFPTANDFY